MKKAFCILLAGFATTASAECYMHSSMKIDKSLIFGRPTDIQKIVTPDEHGSKCVLRYRLNIANDWQTVEGEATGSTDEMACARAIDVSRGNILVEAEAETAQADTQMVCSDLPDIRVHPVNIGDEIWESEVDVHTIPAERPYFKYKYTECRMYVERDARYSNLYIYQGIICRNNATAASKWRVIDKY
jgi:hypothetical protein